MEPILFDSIFVIVTAIVALGISRCGGVRAGLWVVGILLSAVVMLNMFESVTKILMRQYASYQHEFAWPYGRFLCLLVLFVGSLGCFYFLLRWLLPNDPELSGGVDVVSRWGFGVAGGYLVAALMLVALHTYPGSEEFGGYFHTVPSERPGFVMRSAPDYQLLKLTQMATESGFPIGSDGELYPEELEAIGQENGRWAPFPLRYSRWRLELEKQQQEVERQAKEDARQNAEAENSE